MIEFTVAGQAVGKGRPRFARRGKFVSTYTPKKTAEYEQTVREAYQTEAIAKGIKPLEGCLKMYIYAMYKIPSSATSKAKKAALNGQPAPTLPDIDNVVKCIADSINGIAYADDNQIVEIHAVKRYTAGEPYTKVTLLEVDHEQAPD
jgi:Holliday junction resolvase RusA-like endonuclease